MSENNLPDLEDSPWLCLSKEEIEDLRKQKQELTEYGKEKIRKLMNKEPTHEEMLEEAARREAAMKAVEKLYDENGDALKQLAEIERNEVIVAKVSEEDYEKVTDAAERQRLAKKPFKDLTDQERIKLALEELDWIVLGGQDGEEFYNSIQFIRRVLKSFR